MNIIIRVNASKIVGSGHFYRTLYLAKVLKSNNNVMFLCDNLEKEYVKILNKEKFKHFFLKKKTKKNYEKQDIKQTINFLNKSKTQIDLLILDSYLIGIKWETNIKKIVKKILVIDDTKRKHNCDIYLNQNLLNKNLTNRITSKKCLNLIGPKYLIINPDLNLTKKKNFYSPIKTVLIFMGGADTNKLTSKIIKILSKKIFKHLNLNVVIGLNNNCKQKIYSLAKIRPKTKIFYNLQNFIKLIKNSDIAISGGGSSLWEFVYLRLPSLIICQNILQFNNLSKFKNYGTFSLFKSNNNMIKFLKVNLLNKKKITSNKIKNIFDGNGIYRIKKIIGKIK